MPIKWLEVETPKEAAGKPRRFSIIVGKILSLRANSNQELVDAHGGIDGDLAALWTSGHQNMKKGSPK
jgi:hypothetical protein